MSDEDRKQPTADHLLAGETSAAGRSNPSRHVAEPSVINQEVN